MSKRSWLRGCAELLTLGLVLVALASSAARAEPLPAAARAPAPPLTLPALEGDAVGLEALRGHVVVLAFWATWCAPCLLELPHLQVLADELPDQLVVLAISTDGPETRAEVASLVRERGLTLPVLLDETGAATELLNPRGTNPFTVVLDRSGRIAATHEGYAPGDERTLRATVLAVLDEPLAAQDAPQSDTRPGLTLTHTVLFEYHADNGNRRRDDDHFATVVDRLNLGATAGRFTIATRTDTVIVLSEPAPEGFADDARLERLTIRYQDHHLGIIAGDFYRQLGRGIALSLRKLDEAAVDIALRGLHLDYREPRVGVSLFGGITNPVNLDDVSRRFVPDVHDVVTGLSASVRAAEPLDLGLHAVYLTPEEALLGERRHTVTAGTTVELSRGAVDWLAAYLEVDAQYRESLGVSDYGLAAYATLDLWPSDTLSFLVEGLYLRDFDMLGSRNAALEQPFALNQPPTLERIDQEIANQRDVAGGRLRAELSCPATDLTLILNLALRIEDPEELASVMSLHGWLSARWQSASRLTRLEASAGYRHESQFEELIKGTAHAEADLVQHLVATLSLHLQLLHETISRQDPFRSAETLSSHRGSALAALDLAGTGSLAAEVGYDTLEEEARNLFISGILSWQARDAFDLQLVVGTRRGGLRCIAGVCRNFPPFAGAQLRIVNRF